MCVCVLLTPSVTPLEENHILEIELGKIEPAAKRAGYRLTAMRHILLLVLLMRLVILQNVFISFQGSGCRDEGYFVLNDYISNQNRRISVTIVAILTDRPAFRAHRARRG